MISFPKISPTTLTNHKNTAVIFVVTVFANLLPLIMGILGAIAGETWFGLSKFYESGEFYIYSTSLLGPSFMIFYTFKRKNYDKLSLMFFTSLFIAFVSSFWYALLIADRTKYNQILSPTSYGILGLTLVIYYYAAFIDQSNREPDVVGRERQSVNRIMDELGGH